MCCNVATCNAMFWMKKKHSPDIVLNMFSNIGYTYSAIAKDHIWLNCLLNEVYFHLKKKKKKCLKFECVGLRAGALMCSYI